MEAVKTIITLLGDLTTFFWLALRRQSTLAAENLFLRKQLAMFQERKAKPHRPDTPLQITLVLLSRLFNWRDALVVVQPLTLIRWHRQGFHLFWRWKSRPGRPPIPIKLRQRIRDMALNNPPWCEERIANELLLKLGIWVSPRTVRKYMPKSPPGHPRSDQRWSTFVRNHASAILACDFCVVVTATFRLLYVYMAIEHQSRRIVHCNVITNPTADWTLQQLREAIADTKRRRG
jgi:putative transposase